jgi:hypothetical protein
MLSSAVPIFLAVYSIYSFSLLMDWLEDQNSAGASSVIELYIV